MSSHPASTFGIVFSGGGARGAYQAGVARGLFEVLKESGDLSAFRILTGVSAGAINTAYIASQVHQLDNATHNLCEIWRNIKAEHVYHTDTGSVTANAFKVLRSLALGGISDRLRPKFLSLLNTAPLHDLIAKSVDFDQLRKNIHDKHLHALTVTSIDYATSLGVTFVMGDPKIPMWTRASRVSVRSDITTEHVLASSSIPLFFPPIKIEDRYYGDGCLRNAAPLSPAIHVGADRLFVIGVRKWKPQSLDVPPKLLPTLGRILSVVINALFMDAVEADLERLKIMNKYMGPNNAHGLKHIDTLYLSPSQDLAEIARQHNRDLPKMIRIMIGGLGTPAESAEMLSYLLFEPGYCSALVELGIADVRQRRDEVLNFAKT